MEKFVAEYRERNGSITWLVAAAAVPEGRRLYSFEAEMIEEDKTYDFRVFTFGANEFSDAAYESWWVWFLLGCYRPYVKMAAFKLFFCLYSK